ncbi:MAG: serine kinase [Planctomycetota bacterium]|nr:serine kinase [Planctomycetota bacterium]
MKLDEICRRLSLENLTPELSSADVDVTSGFASDLLSDVLANADRGSVLVTVQVHLNVIAVAVHAELAAVVFAAGRKPEEAVRLKAVEEKIPLLVSAESAFDVVGRLYGMGIRGRHA